MGTARQAEYRPSNSCRPWDGRCRTACERAVPLCLRYLDDRLPGSQPGRPLGDGPRRDTERTMSLGSDSAPEGHRTD
jgi:hypothetical protein